MGCTPCQKAILNASHAKRRLAVIPATKIINFPASGAVMKLSLARNSFSLLGSSPLSLTNHHKGIRLIVYSVPFLSLVTVKTLGGIPIPNS